jgi:hypothetical protein
MRQEARKLYAVAARGPHVPAVLATQALTNLGNALDKAHRWAEAYDAYVEALRVDATNGVASGCAAQVLWRCVRLGVGDRERVTTLAHAYGRHSHDNAETVLRYGGQHAVDTFAKLPVSEPSAVPPPIPAGLDDYRSFVVRNRLVLTPFVEAADMQQPRWDDLSIWHLTESIDAPHEPPALFAMFNVMKEDFLLARQLAFSAVQGDVPDPGVYADTLDYANYGTASAALRSAQRLALDVLDKIASALNDLLAIGASPTGVYFTNVWHQRDGSLRTAVEDEIEQGNVPLVALTEVREDLVSGGYLETKRSLRHSSTHRFTIVHEMLVGGY